MSHCTDCAKYRIRIDALGASHKKLVEVLTSIRDQVANGRLCYFGDHTGYEPQIGSNQVEQWTAALREAEKVGE